MDVGLDPGTTSNPSAAVRPSGMSDGDSPVDIELDGIPIMGCSLDPICYLLIEWRG